MFIFNQQQKLSLFYAPKIIKIVWRITNLQSIEKWLFLWETTKCNKFEHFSFSR